MTADLDDLWVVRGLCDGEWEDLGWFRWYGHAVMFADAIREESNSYEKVKIE